MGPQRPVEASLCSDAGSNVKKLMETRLAEAGWVPDQAPFIAHQLIKEAQRSCAEAGRRMALLLPNEGTVLTCGHSATVVQALREAYLLGKELTAMALPSAGYGRLMVAEARRLGVAMTVVNTLPKGLTPQSTAGLIGAASVVPGKLVVSGAPCLGLARWCFDRGLPFYVTCTSLELVDQPSVGKAVLPPGVQRVPMRYVTAIVTETSPHPGSRPL